MRQNEKKKGSSILPGIIFAAIVLFGLLSDASEDAILTVIGLAAVLLPVVLFIMAIAWVVKRAKKTTQHSHDRIDHSTDLRINPKTGKADPRTTYRNTSHSAKEHWKQQLDGLLSNGTIDKAEYRALMKRRF